MRNTHYLTEQILSNDSCRLNLTPAMQIFCSSCFSFVMTYVEKHFMKRISTEFLWQERSSVHVFTTRRWKNARKEDFEQFIHLKKILTLLCFQAERKKTLSSVRTQEDFFLLSVWVLFGKSIFVQNFGESLCWSAWKEVMKKYISPWRVLVFSAVFPWNTSLSQTAVGSISHSFANRT